MKSFADGLLDETDDQFIYKIELAQFKELDFESLPTVESCESYEFVTDIDIDDRKVTLTYQKPEGNLKLLTNEKVRLQKNEAILLSVVEQILLIIEKEMEKGYFVLPTPENFMLDKENNIFFMYKANPNMPITGFNFTKIYQYTIVLLFYLMGENSYEDLVKKKSFKTENKLLIDLSSTKNFQEAKAILGIEEPSITEDEEIEEEQPPIIVDDKLPQTEKTVENKTVKQQVKTVEKKVKRKKELKPKHQEVAHVKKEKNSSFSLGKLSRILFAIGVISILLNSYLITEKILYPSTVHSLRNDNKALIVENDELKEKNKKLDQEKTEIEEIRDSTQKELDQTVDQLKQAIEQNKVLREVKK